jgi:hypothetical protein
MMASMHAVNIGITIRRGPFFQGCRGRDWDAMTADERETIIDDLVPAQKEVEQ